MRQRQRGAESLLWRLEGGHTRRQEPSGNYPITGLAGRHPFSRWPAQGVWADDAGKLKANRAWRLYHLLSPRGHFRYKASIISGLEQSISGWPGTVRYAATPGIGLRLSSVCVRPQFTRGTWCPRGAYKELETSKCLRTRLVGSALRRLTCVSRAWPCSVFRVDPYPTTRAHQCMYVTLAGQGRGRCLSAVSERLLPLSSPVAVARSTATPGRAAMYSTCASEAGSPIGWQLSVSASSSVIWLRRHDNVLAALQALSTGRFCLVATDHPDDPTVRRVHGGSSQLDAAFQALSVTAPAQQMMEPGKNAAGELGPLPCQAASHHPRCQAAGPTLPAQPQAPGFLLSCSRGSPISSSTARLLRSSALPHS